MRTFLLLFFSLTSFAAPNEILKLTVSDSINPGSADYIIHGIQKAEETGAAYVLLELDTPGGLLTSTRKIVQKMLGSQIPIVVYISPKGAQAGSAGALITFAADVAAMAPGTNIGAAHPVSAGGENIEKTMQEKIANDTAAFAESLAKTKGRNTEWAKKAVHQSASIIAEDALKNGVIDFMAENTTSLIEKLNGFKLKSPKGKTVTLPTPASSTTHDLPQSLKHKVVSFFADPNIAYLIMTLGGLCIWVELTHPGLIFPGVLGGLCILLSLVSFQMLPIHYGALFMILAGMALLIAELFFPSFGALGIGGILSFIFGSLYLMDTDVPELQVSLGLIFPAAAVLACVILLLSYVLMKSRKALSRSGVETLIGAFAEIRETVSEKSGKVFVQGELWNAITTAKTPLKPGTVVVVREIRNMLLVVDLKESI